MGTTGPTYGATPGKRIAILGNVGTKNLGDEATLAAVLQNIRRRDPSARLLAFVVYPADTRQRHSLEVYPQRRGSKYRSSAHTEQPARTPVGATGGLSALCTRM